MDIRFEKRRAAAVTGHRPNKIGGYNPHAPLRLAIREELKKTVRQLIGEGYNTFISGMALGVDQDFAKVVLDLKNEFPHIRMVAAVPFAGQDGNWPEDSRLAYRDLLARCDEIVYVCEPGYSAWKMQRRNEWMVDHASVLIAVWNGTPGGTANCVRYAQTKPGIRIIRIDPRRLAKAKGGIVHVS